MLFVTPNLSVLKLISRYIAVDIHYQPLVIRGPIVLNAAQRLPSPACGGAGRKHSAGLRGRAENPEA